MRPISQHSARFLAAQAGITLIEIMVVLAIMGMGMALFLGGNLLKSDEDRLREASVEVLATLRAAHNLATMTGKHHRVIFNLKEQTYHMEVCSGLQTIQRGDEEEVVDVDKLEKLRERMEQPVTSDFNQEVIEASTPEEAIAAAAALDGVRLGTTRCLPATDTLSGQPSKSGNRHKLDVDRGIHIEEIHVQHLYESVKETTVSVNFFPVGSAEKAIVRIANEDGEENSILLHGLTSRVEYRNGEVDPDEHMRRNGVGDEVDEK
ncbi:MAG: prepilin-type N-terminal cleavage/methylation domain-containing protein [Myxococcales bacterium]|nr:prepilin-type N-terminal cleavage/methylation domain-containing protein [Myxococcales bacterium]